MKKLDKNWFYEFDKDTLMQIWKSPYIFGFYITSPYILTPKNSRVIHP